MLLQPQSDARQAVARRPAHRRREGVAVLGSPELPDTGIRLVEQRCGTLPECFEPVVLVDITGVIEALVEESLRGGEDHRAVNIVLTLPVSKVTYAHRPHALDSGERRDRAFA